LYSLVAARLPSCFHLDLEMELGIKCYKLLVLESAATASLYETAIKTIQPMSNISVMVISCEFLGSNPAKSGIIVLRQDISLKNKKYP
jgi:hypothetical protein